MNKDRKREDKTSKSVFTFFSRKKDHPYFKILYDNLERMNFFQEDISETKDFFKVFNKNIVHLHWIDSYMRVKDNYLLSVLKASFFLSLFYLMKILGKKFVITLHEISPHKEKFPSLEKKCFQIFLNTIADKVVVHNKYSKQKAIEEYGTKKEKFSIIPHMNFIGYYKNNITKKYARKELGIPKNAKVALFFGTPQEYKGKEKLPEIINIFLKKGYYFLIAGKIKDTDFLEKIRRIEKKGKLKIFNKYIEDDEIQKYMNASDLGIQPYKKIYTSGISYLFASFKKPLICSNLLPLKEDFYNGAIFYKDIKDLEKILPIKEKELDKKSEKIYEIAKKNSSEKIVRSTAKLYKEILK